MPDHGNVQLGVSTCEKLNLPKSENVAFAELRCKMSGMFIPFIHANKKEGSPMKSPQQWRTANNANIA